MRFEIGEVRYPASANIRSMADISRRLLSSSNTAVDPPRSSSTRDPPGAQDDAGVRRLSFPLELTSQALPDRQADRDASTASTHVRSNSLRVTKNHRPSSSPSVVVNDLPLEPNLNHMTPRKNKKNKSKKPDGGSTASRSYKVHGGNPKWAWKK